MVLHAYLHKQMYHNSAHKSTLVIRRSGETLNERALDRAGNLLYHVLRLMCCITVLQSPFPQRHQGTIPDLTGFAAHCSACVHP